MFITLVDRRVTPRQMHHTLRQLFGDQRTLFRLHDSAATVITPLPINDLSQKLNTSFEVGEKVTFRARLNPVASRAKVKGQRGQKYVVPVEERVEWATERFARAGLDVAAVKERKFGSDIIHKGEARVIWADFEGTGTVSDPASLADAMTIGLGRQKAFGCGLLEVNRVR